MLIDDPRVSTYIFLLLEYITMGVWLAYNLIKYLRIHHSFPSEVFTFCSFVILFCISRVSVMFAMIIGIDHFGKGLMIVLGFMFRFTALSEITRYWCTIFTMNRLELLIDMLESTIRKEKVKYFVANAGVYVIFAMLAILYRLDFIPDKKYDNVMPWIFRLYQGFLSVLMLITLYISGYKLINIVNQYCTRRPTKLIVNMTVALIAYFYETVITILTAISPYLFGAISDDWNQDIFNLLNCNIVEIIPIVCFYKSVILSEATMREYSKTTVACLESVLFKSDLKTTQTGSVRTHLNSTY